MSSDSNYRSGGRRWRHLRPLAAGAALAASLFALGAATAHAVVFHSRDEALPLAFPGADRTEARDFFLTAAQREEIERAARAPLESELLTIYVGWRRDEVLGFAILDTHIVRTLPETFMIVLSPTGAVRATHVLAFYEPTDYMPSERWLRQFADKTAADDLRLGRSIDGITGSTLSARAVTDAIRRALAIHATLLDGH